MINERKEHRYRRFLYIEIARKFKENPSLFRKAGLERLHTKMNDMSQVYIDSWDEILTSYSNQHVLKILCCKGEPYESLRQVCPLTFIVPNEVMQNRILQWKERAL